MRRALLHVVWMVLLIAPTAVGAQEAVPEVNGPWWLRAIYFIVSLPYTLWMVFVDGQQLHLLPAPLLGFALCLWSFREWRRQRFWTPRIIHVLAILGLVTIVLINVDWVMAGGEMWTQRYVVIAIFGLFPYVAYLLFLGPKFMGRKHAAVHGTPMEDSDDPMGFQEPLRDRPPRRAAPSHGGSTGVRASLGVLGLMAVAALGLIMAAGSRGPVSVERPELEALHVPESVVRQARGVAKGDPGARFTIMVFGDYQCPACGRFARSVQPRLDSAYVETGRAEFVFFDLPLTSMHANAFLAARAAHCAEDQDGFWAYQDELYRRQDEWSELSTPHDSFEEAAGAIGLDRAAFRGCLDSDRHTDVVEANRELARRFGIRSTPNVVVSLHEAVPREVSRNSFRSIVQTVEAMDSLQRGDPVIRRP